MLELYKAETRRFARWSTGVGALHLLALFMLDRLFPWLRENGEIAILAGTLYGAAGVIFGVYQAASYARMNHWIALLHRPLAPWRIMTGVVGGAATVLALAILIPLLIYTATLTLQTGRIVDARHWLLVVSGTLIGLIGLLIGSYAALAPRRYGWTGAIATIILIASNNAGGSGALLLQVILIATLALLIAGAFKPDRVTAPANPWLQALTGGMAALSIYFVLLVGGGFAYQLTLVAIGRNPLVNSPPPGGLVEASRADSVDLIAGALAASPGRETAGLRAHLPGAKLTRLPVAMEWLPMTGELTDAGPITFVDQRRSIAWTYSHDSRSFRGLRLKDRRSAGELRPPEGFAQPPRLIDKNMMIAGADLYRFDPESGRIERLARLPRGEVIVAKPVPAEGRLAILGDRALHLVTPAGDGAARPAAGSSARDLVVPLPGAIGSLRRLELATLSDRVLVSFFFGRDSIEGPLPAWQQVVSIAPDGARSVLAQRAFAPEFSSVLRFRAYWLSPALHEIAVAAEQIGTADVPILRRGPIEIPGGVWIAAALLSLTAAAGTFALARRRRLSSGARIAWTVAAAALGLPLLAAFWLLSRKPRT